jgi:hypothetical protein
MKRRRRSCVGRVEALGVQLVGAVLEMVVVYISNV